MSPTPSHIWFSCLKITTVMTQVPLRKVWRLELQLEALRVTQNSQSSVGCRCVLPNRSPHWKQYKKAKWPQILIVLTLGWLSVTLEARKSETILASLESDRKISHLSTKQVIILWAHLSEPKLHPNYCLKWSNTANTFTWHDGPSRPHQTYQLTVSSDARYCITKKKKKNPQFSDINLVLCSFFHLSEAKWTHAFSVSLSPLDVNRLKRLVRLSGLSTEKHKCVVFCIGILLADC